MPPVGVMPPYVAVELAVAVLAAAGCTSRELVVVAKRKSVPGTNTRTKPATFVTTPLRKEDWTLNVEPARVPQLQKTQKRASKYGNSRRVLR